MKIILPAFLLANAVSATLLESDDRYDELKEKIFSQEELEGHRPELPPDLTTEQINQIMQEEMELFEFLTRDENDKGPFHFSWEDEDEDWEAPSARKADPRDIDLKYYPFPPREERVLLEDDTPKHRQLLSEKQKREEDAAMRKALDSPLGVPFTFQTVATWVHPKIQGLDGRTPLVMLPCNAAWFDNSNKCGHDACVSFRIADIVKGDQYIRVLDNGGGLKLQNKNTNGNYQKDTSFCLRPGITNVYSFSLESVENPGSFVEQDEDTAYWKLKQRADLDDEQLASFTMSMVGRGRNRSKMCTRSSHCKHKGTYFCHGSSKVCTLKRENGQTCEEGYQCKSGKCVFIQEGSLMLGTFKRLCEAPDESDVDEV